MTESACVVANGDRLGESPVWSVAEQRLYWVDARGPAVWRLHPATGMVERVSLPAVVGSIALRRGGGLIAAMQTGLHRLDFESGALEFIADPEADLPDNRFNDGRCDRRGRFWVGTMSDVAREPTGSLYRLDPDGGVTWMRGDIIVPNSIAFSPDDRTLYFADTYRHRMMTFPFSLDDGLIGEASLFVDDAAGPGRPDGSTVDAEGFLWNAKYAGGRVVRYDPKGRVDREIRLPVSQVTSCAFGGPDLSTLYVTSASQRLSPEQRAAEPLAGGVFAIDVGVRGLPEPEYAG